MKGYPWTFTSVLHGSSFDDYLRDITSEILGDSIVWLLLSLGACQLKKRSTDALLGTNYCVWSSDVGSLEAGS